MPLTFSTPNTGRNMARVALLALLALALIGLIDPRLRPLEVGLPGDKVSHLLIIYGVTLLAIVSFPGVKALHAAAAVGAVAAAVEIAQAMGLMAGSAQASDLAADILGIGMAWLPIAAARPASYQQATS